MADGITFASFAAVVEFGRSPGKVVPLSTLRRRVGVQVTRALLRAKSVLPTCEDPTYSTCGCKRPQFSSRYFSDFFLDGAVWVS
jgi:hypothetical protein